jgi:hypothetical protein
MQNQLTKRNNNLKGKKGLCKCNESKKIDIHHRVMMAEEESLWKHKIKMKRKTLKEMGSSMMKI